MHLIVSPHDHRFDIGWNLDDFRAGERLTAVTVQELTYAVYVAIQVLDLPRVRIGRRFALVVMMRRSSSFSNSTATTFA